MLSKSQIIKVIEQHLPGNFCVSKDVIQISEFNRGCYNKISGNELCIVVDSIMYIREYIDHGFVTETEFFTVDKVDILLIRCISIKKDVEISGRVFTAVKNVSSSRESFKPLARLRKAFKDIEDVELLRKAAAARDKHQSFTDNSFHIPEEFLPDDPDIDAKIAQLIKDNKELFKEIGYI